MLLLTTIRHVELPAWECTKWSLDADHSGSTCLCIQAANENSRSGSSTKHYIWLWTLIFWCRRLWTNCLIVILLRHTWTHDVILNWCTVVTITGKASLEVINLSFTVDVTSAGNLTSIILRAVYSKYNWLRIRDTRDRANNHYQLHVHGKERHGVYCIWATHRRVCTAV